MGDRHSSKPGTNTFVACWVGPGVFLAVCVAMAIHAHDTATLAVIGLLVAMIALLASIPALDRALTRASR